MFHPKGPTFLELAQQGLSSTRRGYDLLAPKFDYTPFRTPLPLIAMCLEQIRSRGPFERTADICTGTGTGIEGLIPITRKHILGIDWSQPMLLEAREKFKTIISPNIDLVCQDMFDINYPERFDLVTFFGAQGHIEKHRYQEFTDKIASILRPGGLFVFITSERPRVYSLSFLLAFIFDALMKIRNFFIKPKFIMYYLNFLIPEISTLFEREPWDNLEVVPIKISFDEKTTITTPLRIVIARKH